MLMSDGRIRTAMETWEDSMGTAQTLRTLAAYYEGLAMYDLLQTATLRYSSNSPPPNLWRCPVLGAVVSALGGCTPCRFKVCGREPVAKYCWSRVRVRLFVNRECSGQTWGPKLKETKEFTHPAVLATPISSETSPHLWI